MALRQRLVDYSDQISSAEIVTKWRGAHYINIVSGMVDPSAVLDNFIMSEKDYCSRAYGIAINAARDIECAFSRHKVANDESMGRPL